MFWDECVDEEAGPYKVLLKRGDFIDEGRDGRAVPYKIYYPDFSTFPAEAGGHGLEKIPVILWSHGLGGNRDGAAFISRYVASHGYVIVHLTHDGTDSSLWEGKDGHPWDIIRNTHIPREATLNRFADVPFAVDALMRWAEENPEIGAVMDFEALGICGHSFGAMTTQVMAGQLALNMDDDLVSYRDERFKAGIVYSPVPIAHLTDAPPEDLYGPISIPLLHMSGTADDSPVAGFNYKHRLVVHEHTAHKEKYLLVKKDGDHMVYNGTRGKLAANPLRFRHENLIKVASLAFWEAQLKNDVSAREWLSEEGISAYIAEDAEFEANT